MRADEMIVYLERCVASGLGMTISTDSDERCRQPMPGYRLELLSYNRSRKVANWWLSLRQCRRMLRELPAKKAGEA